MPPTNIRWTVAKRILELLRARQVTDGATTSTDATLTSATAAFTAADVGRPITGTGISTSTTVASVTNATTIEMSAPATATATGVTITIGEATMVGVGVHAGWPGDEAGRDTLWLDDLDGEIDIPVFSAGRKYRDDKFDVPLEIRVVADGRTHDDTMERATVIAAAIEDVLADDPSIGNLDGVISGEVLSEKASAGEVRGTGFIAFAEVVVSIHARLE